MIEIKEGVTFTNLSNEHCKIIRVSGTQVTVLRTKTNGKTIKKTVDYTYLRVFLNGLENN